MGCLKPQSWYFTFCLSTMLLGERSEGAAAFCAGAARAGQVQGRIRSYTSSGICSQV